MSPLPHPTSDLIQTTQFAGGDSDFYRRQTNRNTGSPRPWLDTCTRRCDAGEGVARNKPGGTRKPEDTFCTGGAEHTKKISVPWRLCEIMLFFEHQSTPIRSSEHDPHRWLTIVSRFLVLDSVTLAFALLLRVLRGDARSSHRRKPPTLRKFRQPVLPECHSLFAENSIPPS